MQSMDNFGAMVITDRVRVQSTMKEFRAKPETTFDRDKGTRAARAQQLHLSCILLLLWKLLEMRD